VDHRLERDWSGAAPEFDFLHLLRPILLGFAASLIWGWDRLAASLLLWSLVGYFVLFYSLMHEGLRYRLPADALMMLLAAFAAVTIYDRYLKRGALHSEPSHV